MRRGDMLDRGVAPDVWSRNLRKTLGNSSRDYGDDDRTRLADAIRAAYPGKRISFLNNILLQLRKGQMPTPKQLTAVNDLLEKVGHRRVACRVKVTPGYYRERAQKVRERQATELDAALANRPKLPPGRVR